MANVNLNINGIDNLSPILNRIQSQINQLQNSTRNINIGGGSGGGGSLVGQIASGVALGNIYTRLAKLAVDFSFSSIKAFMELEKAQKTFSFAMGKSAGELAKLGGEIERLRIVKFANEFGISAKSASEDFGKFAAAIKGSNISLSEGEIIFKGVTKAAATFGLSSEQTQRIFKALTDIVSKGKLQSQELVQQLGNNLPGATNLFARSLGITSSKLRELMKEGKITSEMLVQFGKYLDQIYDKSARSNLNTLQGQMNLLANSFMELSQTLGEDLAPGLTKIIEALKTIVDKSKEVWQNTFGKSEEAKVAAELAAEFENTPEGKKAKALEKNPKALGEYATQLSDRLALQTVKDFKELEKNVDIQKFLTGEEQKRYTDYLLENKPTPELESEIAKMVMDRMSKVKEVSSTEASDFLTTGEKSLPMYAIGKVMEGVGYVGRTFAENMKWIETPAIKQQETITEGELPKGIKSMVENYTRNKGISELISKKAADAGVPLPTDGEDDKNKLKTDYHTPKIININILTGEGASMINGGVMTNIETSSVDSREIKNQLKSLLTEELDMVLQDTASAVMRVATHGSNHR